MSLEQFFVFNEANFVNGQARVLYSPLDVSSPVAVPTNIDDVFAMTSPYAPVTGWVDFGGTSAPPQYARALSVNEWKVQQQLSAVLEVPNQVVRTVKIPAAEFARPDLLQLFENGNAPSAIAAATGSSAQAFQPFGQFTDLTQYRIVIAAFQPLEAGTVVEGTSGPTRPRLVVQTFYRASLTAENVTVNYEIGDMVTADLTLKCYPEPSQDQNAEYGGYFIEAAGTITVG